MQQASWNLCPAGDSSGCYWSSDQTFEQLTGSVSVVVPDVPDGGRPRGIPAAHLAAWMPARASWCMIACGGMLHNGMASGPPALQAAGQ